MDTTLKSGEPVPAEELYARLLKGIEEDGNRQTQVRESEDGGVIVSKAGSRLVTEAQGDLGPPDEEGLKSLVLLRDMPWRDEYVDRAIAYFASDERVDGHGDIVRQSWIFDEFEKNSPMPYSHEWYAPPIGRIIDWRGVRRSEADYNGPALWLLGLFATKDDWDWADTIFRLVKARILTSGSVGFKPDKVIDVKDDKERQDLGLGRWGLIFEDNHLLEYSPTTIPANAGAHSIASTLPGCKGLLKPQDVHMIRELQRQQAQDREEFIKSEEMILAIAKTIWPEEEFRFHSQFDVPVTLMNDAHPRTLTGGVSLSSDGDAANTADPVSPEAQERTQALTELTESIEKMVSLFTDELGEMKQVLSDLRDGFEALTLKRSGEGEGEGDSIDESKLEEAVSSAKTLIENLTKLKG